MYRLAVLKKSLIGVSIKNKTYLEQLSLTAVNDAVFLNQSSSVTGLLGKLASTIEILNLDAEKVPSTWLDKPLPLRLKAYNTRDSKEKWSLDRFKFR